VLAQAGGSARGRQFAAAHADTIVAQVKTVEEMKEYRDAVRKVMAAQGRNPDHCKVLFTVFPILGDTDEEANERYRRKLAYLRDNREERLASFAKLINVNLNKFDLDKPLPDDVVTNGHQHSLATYRKFAAGRSIRVGESTRTKSYRPPIFHKISSAISTIASVQCVSPVRALFMWPFMRAARGNA
jgi:alkanesulfonate monooxygenase SsuD/methylene tetrahydromethanopterin reductase-like flavin-dependent oxidoreductase (luciferase family)